MLIELCVDVYFMSQWFLTPHDDRHNWIKNIHSFYIIFYIYEIKTCRIYIIKESLYVFIRKKFCMFIQSQFESEEVIFFKRVCVNITKAIKNNKFNHLDTFLLLHSNFQGNRTKREKKSHIVSSSIAGKKAEKMSITIIICFSLHLLFFLCLLVFTWIPFRKVHLMLIFRKKTTIRWKFSFLKNSSILNSFHKKYIRLQFTAFLLCYEITFVRYKKVFIPLCPLSRLSR